MAFGAAGFAETEALCQKRLPVAELKLGGGLLCVALAFSARMAGADFRTALCSPHILVVCEAIIFVFGKKT